MHELSLAYAWVLSMELVLISDTCLNECEKLSPVANGSLHVAHLVKRAPGFYLAVQQCGSDEQERLEMKTGQFNISHLKPHCAFTWQHTIVCSWSTLSHNRFDFMCLCLHVSGVCPLFPLCFSFHHH